MSLKKKKKAILALTVIILLRKYSCGTICPGTEK